MMWHFLEVWLLFLGVFAVGCMLGALIHDASARTALAGAQAVTAGAVGSVVDAVKERLGAGPDRRAYQEWAAQPAAPEAQNEAVAALPPPVWQDETATPISADEDRPDDADLPQEVTETAALVPYTPKELTVEAGEAPSGSTSWLEDETAMMRPAMLSAPRAGVPDNLQRIRGIGRRNELLLHSLGIYHFGQIAAWTPAELHWVAAHLPFPERIERDDWIGQAIILASGGDTGFDKATERKMNAAWGEDP